MAVFDIPLVVPDNKVAELIDALNWHLGQIQDGTNPDGTPIFRDRTGAELRAWLKQSQENILKDIFRRHKEYLRDQTVIDTTIDIT